jgi:SAM-dependent methyltransferase
VATIEEVASELGLDPLAAGKVIRAVTALGVVAADGDGYRLAEPLRPHFDGGPGDLHAFIAHSHNMYNGWGENLESWLKGEGWESSAACPENHQAFGAAMRAMGSQIARRTADRLDLGAVRTMLDVGGGFGHFARELCRRAPELTATVLDVPGVAEIASKEMAGDPMLGRISFRGGDYLADDYGTGFDLVLFANVLHQELGPDAAAMVRRGADALAPGGRMAVVDFQIDDARHEQVFGALFAVNMRSFGDTHTEPAIRGWMETAGLGEVQRTDLDEIRWLIIGKKPD